MNGSPRVEDIVALFTRDPEAAEYFAREPRQKEALYACVRVSVEFAEFLADMPARISPSEDRVDWMNDTIRFALEFFEEIRALEKILERRHARVFEWQGFESPEALAARFHECLDRVTAEGLGTEARMSSLLLALRCQLVFWATTFA